MTIFIIAECILFGLRNEMKLQMLLYFLTTVFYGV